MYIHRPRIKFNGTYIAEIKYSRPGATEGDYIQPVHLITFYRYLQFYEFGVVISLISNDPPAKVLERLKEESYDLNNREGAFVGEWRIN